MKRGRKAKAREPAMGGNGAGGPEAADGAGKVAEITLRHEREGDQLQLVNTSGLELDLVEPLLLRAVAFVQRELGAQRVAEVLAARAQAGRLKRTGRRAR